MGASYGKGKPSEKETISGRELVNRLGDVLRRGTDIPEQREEASLGILRLDYDYPPAPGDIDHPGSFKYRVHYRTVPGLTFQMCQDGMMPSPVHAEFVAAIRWLDNVRHVSAITGGFMFWFQDLARQHTQKPVLLSSLVQLPSVITSFAHHEQVAIFTANSCTLGPMHNLIARTCGLDVADNRFVIVGCQNVPGFEAVERGEKVNTRVVQPGIVALAKQVIAEHPGIRAILLECTELPPYADALRYSTGLPVYDSITTADSFICGVLDNPRFGLDGWMRKFDGKQKTYKLGVELDKHERLRCKHCQNVLLDEYKR